MNYNVGSKSGEIQPTPRVHVVQVAVGGVSSNSPNWSKVASVKHGLEPNASDIINEYLNTLDLQPWEFTMHQDSLYDLYRTYRTHAASHDRSSVTALDRLKSFINTSLRRADNINKLL